MTTTSDTGVFAGRYEIGPLLGRGGMGEVRRARDRRLDRDVAIKFLRPDLAAQPDVRARFETEARNAARLTHPNVVLVLDSGEEDGQPFMVMECLPGRSLRDVLADGPVSEADVRRWADEILSALGAAHELGVIHRDVTPSNILITDDGRAKIADFGISKTTEGLSHTAVGQVLGTPAYLAPERVHGDPATPASDLYAVGVVLYEALHGSNPFKSGAPIATAHAVLTTEPPPLVGVDPSLAFAIEAAMAKDPAQRPASADSMRRMLDTEVDETAPLTTPFTTVMPVTTMRGVAANRRVPREAWITILAAVAAGLLLLAVTDHSSGDEDVVANVPSTVAPTTVATTPSTTAAVVSVRVGPAKASREPGKGPEKKPKPDGKR